MRNFLKKHRSQALAYLFYGLVGVFLAVYFASLDYKAVVSEDINYAVFLLATIIGIGGIYWGAFMWLYVLRNLGATNLNKRALFYVYGKSWLGRYIPGTAPWILGKIGFASKHGISKKKLAVSSILEAIFQIIATVLASLLLILLSGQALSLPSLSWVILIIGIAACVIVIHPKVFIYTANKLLRVAKKQEIEPDNHTSLALNTKGILLYSVGTLLTGFAIYLLVNSITSIDSFSDMLYVMGASNLAAVIGMMAVFVPSGLGVREVTFVALLSVVIPVEQAVLVSVISRFWSVLVDLLFYALGYLLQPRQYTE